MDFIWAESRLCHFRVLSLFSVIFGIYRFLKIFVASDGFLCYYMHCKFTELMNAQIAQLVEQRTENPRVAGSIPALGIL